ncbi:MAG: EamA family transporter [Terriglobales bacterium]
MNSAPVSRTRIMAASGAIYLVWGSAYLAMKIGLATIPPLLLAGSRLLLAGTLMAAYAWLRGHRLQRRHLPPLLAAAALLFLGGHGFLYWGQQRVSSGLGAVLFSTIPLWIVLIEGCSPTGIRLGWRALWGLALGLGGIVLLVGPERLLGGGRISLAGAAAISIASLSWALGSIFCTRAALPPSAAMAGGVEMLLGGAMLLIVAPLTGELRGFHPALVSRASLLAIAYLVLFSSMIGFSCYLWLLQVASPARVATYAYVTPMVAVFLGWMLAREAVTARTLASMGLLLAAVVLIVRQQSKRPSAVLAAELEGQAAVTR